MLFMPSDLYPLNKPSLEAQWQKNERLDYCDHPLATRGPVMQALLTWFSMLNPHRSASRV